MTTFGIDISRYQAGIDLAKVREGGEIEFIIAKVSEGTTWRDPEFPKYAAEAKKHGFLFAAYVFLRGEAPVRAQVDNLKGALGADFDKIPVILDLERTTGYSQPTLGTANAFRDRAKMDGIRVTDLLYLPEWYWDVLGRPDTGGWHLWQSRYGANDGKYPGDGAAAWTRRDGRPYAMLQYTSAGRVAGHSGGIDKNAFRGTREELARTGWFIDYKEPSMSITEIQKAVATTPIVIDGEGNTQPLQRVLRRILLAQRTPDQIAAAVVAALPEDEGYVSVTSDEIEEAVKQALREGTG